MANSEPPDATCNPQSDSVTTAMSNDNIGTLAAESKDVAKACPSTFQVAETTTEGMEVYNLGGLSKERIEDPGRCIAPAQPSLRSLIHVVSTETPKARMKNPCLSPQEMGTSPLN